jgi:hypothetical protein
MSKTILWDSDFLESYLKANGPPGKYRPVVSEDARRIAELEQRVAVLEALIRSSAFRAGS